MTRPLRASRTIAIAIAICGLLLGAGGAPAVSATETAPDSSDVALVLDFSASILNDARNRARFAGALERMADRVDALSADLVTGDTTVSLVQFASKAKDVEGCTDLQLLNDPAAVATFADCLRTVGAAYREGLDPQLENAIGIDTNYVEAMEKGAAHLPADSERPAMILFTDGRHDVAGVPNRDVGRAHARLFDDRSPFALLPVGMGLAAGDRDQLTAGLEDLRVVRDMPPCVSGTTFEWPEVVFDSPGAAGSAVAEALQAATCTFTVAPTEPPVTPAPPAAPGVVGNIQLTPGDGYIDMAWSPPAEGADAVTDYRARCTSDGETIEAAGGVSTEPGARVEGLEQGREYRCEVATVTAAGDGEWVAAPGTAAPLGIPPPPAKPNVTAFNGAIEVDVVPADGVEEYRYECSADGGTTWEESTAITSASTSARIRDLANGTDYVCRAFASNEIGVSDASAVSNVVRPCSGLLDCNPAALPIVVGTVSLLSLGILLALFGIYRERSQGYVLAVLDGVHSANIGKRSRLGIEVVRPPGSRQVSEIVANRGKKADFRVTMRRGGTFRVTDKARSQDVASGDMVIVVDSIGVRHQLVLHAFSTKSASAVATRR
jgi:hypothetical protein